MSALQWLWLMVGLQMLLFGLGWLGASHMAQSARSAMRELALFNLLVGIGLGLVGLRGPLPILSAVDGQAQVLPYLLTHAMANVFQMVAFVVLWRATQSLTGQAPTRRLAQHTEHALMLTVGTALVLWLGQSTEGAQQRAAVVLLVIAWVAARSGTQSFQRMRRDASQRRAGLLLALTGWATAAMLAARAASGLFGGATIEFNDGGATGTLGLAFVLLAAVFSLNLLFAYIVFGRMARSLHQLSRHDELTGLLNRRALMESLRTEWTRYMRSRQPLAVLCLDIDHFKTINDTGGHAAGDAVLVALADTLRQHVRGGDVVGRSGGEEFLAVLPATDAAAAHDVAERLRRAVAGHDGLHPEPGRRITVSVGVACAGAADKAVDTVVARADAALYRAKESGRNRVRGDDSGTAQVIHFPARPGSA